MLKTTQAAHTKTLRGFSIGESLLSAFVLTVGLTAIVALVATSLKNAFETRDTVIAVGLAQEGVELVRNVRDNDFAADNDGFTHFSGSNDRHCRIDYTADTGSNLDCNASAGSLSRYTLEYTNGFYKHGSGSSRFARYIYIDYDNNSPKTALVRSFVYWGGGGSGMFRVSDAGNNGDTTKCTAVKKCVFTEINLTSWK